MKSDDASDFYFGVWPCVFPMHNNQEILIFGGESDIINKNDDLDSDERKTE